MDEEEFVGEVAVDEIALNKRDRFSSFSEDGDETEDHEKVVLDEDFNEDDTFGGFRAPEDEDSESNIGEIN